jgi:hypothetical protein
MWAGATATGKMEGNVLTADTVMKNGQKFHDIWILAPDGKSIRNEMIISGGPGRTWGWRRRSGRRRKGDTPAAAAAAPRVEVAAVC